MEQMAADFSKLPTQLQAKLQTLTLQLAQRMKDRFEEEYTTGIAPGNSKPTVYTGNLGHNVQAYAPPGAYTVTLRLNTPYALKLEQGGKWNITNKAAIAVWAREKLGVTDQKAIDRIWRRIRTVGTQPAMLMERAFGAEHSGEFMDLVSQDVARWVQTTMGELHGGSK